MKKERELAKSMTTEADADIIRTNTDIETIMEVGCWEGSWEVKLKHNHGVQIKSSLG